MWYQRGALVLGYRLVQAYRGWSGQWRVLGVLRDGWGDEGSRGASRLDGGQPAGRGPAVHTTPASWRQLHGDNVEQKNEAFGIVKMHAVRISIFRVLWTSRGREEEQGKMARKSAWCHDCL